MNDLLYGRSLNVFVGLLLLVVAYVYMRVVRRYRADALVRMAAGQPDAMIVRRRTVEHVFGTLKHWMGSTHFLTRRLPNVRTEIGLHVLAYNLKRLIAILGFAGTMKAIGSMA